MPQAYGGNNITAGSQIANGIIVNAHIAAAAAIVDTKLATISTASKVSGAALTLLPNIPAGAGTLPAANAPTLLGIWTLRDSGTETSPTIFQAATDLLIVLGFTNAVSGQFKVYTDSGTPPTTLRAQGPTTDATNFSPITVPVKKNDYYKIVQMNKLGAGNNFYTIGLGA